MLLWRHMACECEYALRTLAKTFTVHSDEHWVSRKISYDLTAHCPSGPFPASRCISTCILFCFSITIHKHTMINMYCGTQKIRLIEQRRHLYNDTLLLDASATSYLFSITMNADPVYWVRVMNNYLCRLIICL